MILFGSCFDWLLVSIVVAGFVLKYSVGSKKAGQVGFGAALACSLLPLWFLCRVGNLWALSGTPAEVKPKQEKLAVVVKTVACILWRAVLAVCFWIEIDWEGLETIRTEMGKTGKPIGLIGNHTSFFDVFISVAMCPLSEVGKAKQIISTMVMKLPIMGYICQTMLHLPIPFKNDAGDSKTFEVDKDKLAKIMEEYEAHLKSGGFCAWYPEGQVNRAECSKLQQFRAGGYGIAVRNDIELWCATFCGNAVTWPYYEQMGGHPAKIGVKVWRLCESTKEWLAKNAPGKTGRDAEIFFADHTQTLIQAELDKLLERGYKVGDNTKPGKKKEEEKKTD